MKQIPKRKVVPKAKPREAKPPGPGGGGGGAGEAPGGSAQAAEVPSWVPQQYKGWVHTAAQQTGMPAVIVAAQIKLESDYNPGAVSPTGAQGIAQFEPGTWAGEGCKGSPFIPSDAFPCYIKLMRSLVRSYGGNIPKALAAYNAGPGDLAAGAGYAAEVYAIAGEGGAGEIGDQSGTQILLAGLPSTSQDNWSDYINEARGHLGSTATAINKHKASITHSLSAREDH